MAIILILFLLSTLSLSTANGQPQASSWTDGRSNSNNYQHSSATPTPAVSSYHSKYAGDECCHQDIVYTWAAGCAYFPNITDVTITGMIVTAPNIGACAASCQSLGLATCNTFSYVMKKDDFPPNSCILSLDIDSPSVPGVTPDVNDPDEVIQCGYIGSLPGPQQPTNSSTPSNFMWTSVTVPPTGDDTPIYISDSTGFNGRQLSKGTAFSWADDCDYTNITAVTTIGYTLSLTRDQCVAVCLASYPQCNTFTYDLSSNICTLENQTPPVAPGITPLNSSAVNGTQCGYIGKAAKGPEGFQWTEGAILYCPKASSIQVGDGQVVAEIQGATTANISNILGAVLNLFSDAIKIFCLFVSSCNSG